MDALLLALIHLREVRSLPPAHPIAPSRVSLNSHYTPPDRGIPGRRIGAGTR